MEVSSSVFLSMRVGSMLEPGSARKSSIDVIWFRSLMGPEVRKICIDLHLTVEQWILASARSIFCVSVLCLVEWLLWLP